MTHDMKENEEFLYKYFSGLNPSKIDSMSTPEFLKMSLVSGNH